MKLQCNDCIHKNVCKNNEKWKTYNLEMEEMKEKYPVDWVENNKPFTSCSDYKRDILIGDNVNETNTTERYYNEYKNDGCYNMGDCNVDNNNSYFNNGNYNNGNYNNGYFNNGYFNNGNYNNGDCNNGNYNNGDCNNGSYNVGNANSGGFNIGDQNSGDFNFCNFSNGVFNTKEPTINIFNKPSTWTYEDWLNSNVYNILANNFTNNVWIYKANMTEEEKANHPEYKSTGGYLKVLDFKEAFKNMWIRLNKEQKNIIINELPNFDKYIFKQITGIDIDKDENVTSNICQHTNNNKYNTKNSNDKISNIDKEKQKVTEYYNNFNNVDNILDDMLAYLLK